MKPARDPKYLAAIRQLPCILFDYGCVGAVEAAHTGPHGLGQKSSDRSALPMCAGHHRTGKFSYHKLGPRKFEAKWNIDLAELVSRLNAKPRIALVSGGRFVVQVGGVEYYNGPASNGVKVAVQSALSTWREHWKRGIA